MLSDNHYIEIVFKDKLVYENTELLEICHENGIHFCDLSQLRKDIANGRSCEFDLAISNTFGKLITKDIIDWLHGNIINLHGAILPDYKGMFTYNWGIFNEEKKWGATAHFVNEKFDSGKIIKVSSFDINPYEITISELEKKTQACAYQLSLDMVCMFDEGQEVIGEEQGEFGHYYSREDFEKLKQIPEGESLMKTQQRVRACWNPPYEGAYRLIDGEKNYAEL